eukprot:TRINITY_DN72164_c0_g1_i1.p1 TRINITY_DN72164_c0_g1~~TRINITY_DN72164_c0_g1_i1.p1  ORF type:complete len:627 (-),score=87.41 TRINITY_DN72164_c0_g1_i1:256-2136(-)
MFPATNLVALLKLAAALFLPQLAAVGATSVPEEPWPQQTAWQHDLYQRVARRAAELSRAAEPAVLARLSSEPFRTQLALCCPSFSGLSARELLQKLQDEMDVVEVVSGFPAATSAQEIGLQADGPGMTIADGLAGSFFQNAWQQILLHNSSFDKTVHSYTRVHFNATTDSFTITFHQEPGCPDGAFAITVPLNKCLREPNSGMIFRFGHRTTPLGSWGYNDVWLPQTGNFMEYDACQAHAALASAVGLFVSSKWKALAPPWPITTCPTSKPSGTLRFGVDGVCREGGPFGSKGRSTKDGWQMEDTAETRLYGLRPFSAPGSPATLAEAAERGPYALVNNMLFDAGSPIFGSVSAVFSAKAMRRTALLSAIDTGFYMNTCVLARGSKMPGINCSGYTPFDHLGTMEHFNHLILDNQDFWQWSTSLVDHFARLEGKWGSQPVLSSHLLKYFEAMPASTLKYPEDIRFLIGSFPDLFGTASGAQLQKWARQRGWILVWTLGVNLGVEGFALLQQNITLALNKRLIDPDVALATTAVADLGIENQTVTDFRQSWTRAESLRKRANGSLISNTTWAIHWDRLTTVLPSRLRIMPLRSGKCKQTETATECIGINGDGICVCYSAASENLIVV